jgi:hypothetical protein
MGKLDIFTCSPLIIGHTNGGAMWIMYSIYET